MLSDGTYLGSAASRQDAGVMLDDPVLSGATAASGATLSSGEPLNTVPCGHVPQHSCQVTTSCPLHPVVETDAVMAKDQVADRLNPLSRPQMVSGLLLLQGWPHLNAIVLTVI